MTINAERGEMPLLVLLHLLSATRLARLGWLLRLTVPVAGPVFCLVGLALHWWQVEPLLVCLGAGLAAWTAVALLMTHQMAYGQTTIAPNLRAPVEMALFGGVICLAWNGFPLLLLTDEATAPILRLAYKYPLVLAVRMPNVTTGQGPHVVIDRQPAGHCWQQITLRQSVKGTLYFILHDAYNGVLEFNSLDEVLRTMTTHKHCIAKRVADEDALYRATLQTHD